MSVAGVLTALLIVSQSATQDVPLLRPAHWVDGAEIEPTYHAFSFNALAFTSPDEGWIVGDKYLLHVRGDLLEVAFLDLSDGLRTVSFSNPAVGWIGGKGPPNGQFPLLRHAAGGWRHEQVEGMVWPGWGISRIMAGPAGDAWAIAVVNDDPTHELAWKQSWRMFLRYDGSKWTVDETTLAEHAGVTLGDACQTPDGTWWFVGTDRSAPSSLTAFIARWDGASLIREAVPSSAGERSALSEVRCPADGSVWALGDVRHRENRLREVLLMRHTTDWQRLPVPTDFPGDASATSFAAIDADEVWVSANCGVFQAQCRERFFHLRGGAWETVELPILPGGRSTRMWIVDTQFVSRTEGWAIASDLKPRSGGRIFHYRDGQWRNRNWNWHFWNAPGFGLFGY